MSEQRPGKIVQFQVAPSLDMNWFYALDGEGQMWAYGGPKSDFRGWYKL